MQILTTSKVFAKVSEIRKFALIFGILTRLIRQKAIKVQVLIQLQQGSRFRTKKRRWKKILGGRDILLPIKENIGACKK